MGRKNERGPDDPKAVVRSLMKAGKVKKKCCRSKPRCEKCPVRALKKAQKKAQKKAHRKAEKAERKARRKALEKAEKKARKKAERTPASSEAPKQTHEATRGSACETPV